MIISRRNLLARLFNLVWQNFLYPQPNCQDALQRIRSHKLLKPYGVFAWRGKLVIFQQGNLMIVDITETTHSLRLAGMLIKQKNRQ